MKNTLSVAAICHGTVIDHISQGQAFKIIRLLNLKTQQSCVTIGLHLPSKSMGSKDIIKIEKRILTEQEANEIVVFAPKATINVIENYEVVKKISTRLPEIMRNVFECQNPICITRCEPIESLFYISERGKKMFLSCHYCTKTFDRDQVKIKL